MNKDKSSLLIWFSFLKTLVDNDQVQVDPNNPRVFRLGPEPSSMFVLGRGEDAELFVGVQEAMLPFFTQTDWASISISHDVGYIFLESRDPKDETLNFALGIKLPNARLGIFSDKDRFANIKAFHDQKTPCEQVMLRSQNEASGLQLRFLESMEDLIDAKTGHEGGANTSSHVNPDFPEWFIPISKAFYDRI